MEKHWSRGEASLHRAGPSAQGAGLHPASGPTNLAVQEAFKAGGITEFERHSRLTMVMDLSPK